MDPSRDGGGGLTATGLFCVSCGAQSGPTAKFCSECGARLTQASQSAEYKQVTVLFADVVHSMAIAAAVGAERLREIMAELVDCASAVMLAQQAVKEHKLTPRARIHHISARGADRVFMLTGPIPATRYALEKTGLSIDDIDTVEINEAFAPVVIAWLKEIKADPKKVNPNGGAIALGHPLGATGAKLFATMLNELERTGGRYGLQTMCEGGGTANVTIIERL